METKTYRGKSAKEVLARVSRELGPDADIVDRRLLKGEDGNTVVEVTAAPRVPKIVTPEAAPGLRRSLFANKVFIWGIGVLAVAIVALVVAAIAFQGRGEEEALIQAVDADRVSIAVLPFTDLSPNKDQEYFCDGVAEEIIHKLALIGNLKVISRNSSFYFTGKDVDISEIGRQLGVSTILEGSVRRSGNNLRINARLIEIADKSTIWSGSFDREQKDIFVIQEEIAMAVVDSLELTLGVEEQRRLQDSYETSPEVYELYLRGRFVSSPNTLERLELAIELFDRAIEKDPSFAPAYAIKALCYVNLTVKYASKYPLGPTSQKAQSALARAEELNPELPEVHTAIAVIKYYKGDWQGAEQEFNLALELAPGSSGIHASFGAYYAVIGQFDKAITEYEKALELDPLSRGTNFGMGFTYHAAGRYEEAVKQYEKAKEVFPNYYSIFGWQAFSYAGLGNAEEAIALLDKMESVTDSWGRPNLLWTQALVYAKLGMKEESRRYLNQLLKIMETMYWYPSAVAGVYALLGENDLAFEWLEKAFEEGDPHRYVHLTAAFFWGELPSDPRFDEFLKRAGLPIKK